MFGQPHSTLPRVILELQRPGERTRTLSYSGLTEFHIPYFKLHLECLVLRLLYFLSMISFLGMRLKQKVIKDLSMFATKNIKLFTFTCPLAPRWRIGPHEYQITTYFLWEISFQFWRKIFISSFYVICTLVCAHLRRHLFSCYEEECDTRLILVLTGMLLVSHAHC